jgi:mannosyl-oligosaccharide alpha-1,2-mannosidase
MLYRPMTPGNRDVLFSGSVSTAGDPERDLRFNAEVQHLACFIGGMIGMGSKIFSLEGDLELAKRLADGCVWAYGATPSGIMPEAATVMACESTEHCTWNETAYYEFLDPMGSERDHNLEEYLKAKAAREEELKVFKIAAANKAEQDRTNDEEDHEGFASEGSLRKDDLPEPQHTEEDHHWSLNKSEPISLEKRQISPKEDVPKLVSHNFKTDVAIAKANYQNDQAKSGGLRGVTEKLYQEKSKTTEAELQDLTAGRQSEIPLSRAMQSPIPSEILPDPLQPLSHKEYVEARIKQQGLPPGFVAIAGRKYILR